MGAGVSSLTVKSSHSPGRPRGRALACRTPGRAHPHPPNALDVPKYVVKHGESGEWRRLEDFSSHSRMLSVTLGSGLSWPRTQPSLVRLSMVVAWKEEVGTAEKTCPKSCVFVRGPSYRRVLRCSGREVA